MRVIAAKDPVPMVPEPFKDGAPGFIEPQPAEPVEVESCSYYLRRIASGELLLVPDDEPVADTQLVGRARAKTIAKGGEQ
jgi:hypothetical protein